MDKATLEFVKTKTHELLQAPETCQEAKDAANAYLKALGTPQEKAEAKKFVAEMEADITSIDGLIQFASSDAGKSVFGGPVEAQKVVDRAQELKADGAKYCFCHACTAIAALLTKKDAILG